MKRKTRLTRAGGAMRGEFLYEWGWGRGGRGECWRSKGAELLEEMTIAVGVGVGRREWVGGGEILRWLKLIFC